MSCSFLYLSSAEARLSLGFGEARPTESLFFALRPPAAVAQAARAVAEALAAQRPAAHLMSIERLHVTLYYLGQYAGLPPALLARAQRAAQGLRVAPFALAFDRVGSFDGRRREVPVIALGDSAGSAGIVGLHGALDAALGQAQAQGDARFIPHMTLLHDRAAVAQQALAVPLAWQAETLWLLRSVRGEARYREEGCWPLRG